MGFEVLSVLIPTLKRQPSSTVSKLSLRRQHFRKGKGTVRLRFNVNYDGPVSNTKIVIARCPRRNEFVDVSLMCHLLKCSFLRPSDEAWNRTIFLRCFFGRIISSAETHS